MNKVIKVFLVFLFINFCLNDRIIPDPDFPLLVKYPRRGLDSITTSFEMRFKLPIRTSRSSVNPAAGIGFNQFIGVRFNDGIFSFSSILPSCTLKSATATFVTQAVQPTSSALATTSITDTKVIYCKLIGNSLTEVPGDTTLTLTLNFGTKISNAWIHNISIFTSTSNNPDQLIIDNLPTLGSVGLYADYASANNNKLITILNGGGSSIATVTSPSNPPSLNTLYPGFTFDARIIVQIMQFWIVDPEDFIIYLKYDTSCFQAPTTVTTEDVSSNASELRLTSTLQLTAQTDGTIISGFANGELYPNRKFKLVLSGMKATDLKLEQSTQIELFVYYKNTYSIVSYSNINMDTVKIATLTAEVFHPEYFYMYDGMGWPFQFNIKSPVDIATGGFVVIRHKNKDVTLNNLNFIASTCEMSFGDNSFGKRNNCFPLRNDFFHDLTTGLESTTNNEGSGIFFKIGQISSTTTYTVKVWAFIDKCSSTDTADNKAKNYAATLTFTIRIFKKANYNDTYLNEKIFFDLTKNYILARNTSVVLADNCFPLQTRTDFLTADNTPLADTNFDGRLTSLPLSRIKWTTAAADSLTTYDSNLPIGIELHNLTIVKPASTTDLINASKTSTLFFTYKDGLGSSTDMVSTSSTTLSVKYLFASSSSELSSSNLTFFALYQAGASDSAGAAPLAGYLNRYDFQDYIPNECASKFLNTYITITEPRIQWLFSRDFLTASSSTITGTAGCQVSWLLVDDYDRSTTSMNKTLFYGTGVSKGVNKNLTTITSADISPVTGTDAAKYKLSKNMAASPNSQINSTDATTGTSRTYKITSEAMITTSNSVTTRTLSMTGLNCFDKIKPPRQAVGHISNTARIYNVGTIGVHTTCLNWKATTAVSSMFAYFEVQQILLHNLKYPSRVIRYIKLFPEPGFFQDATALDAAAEATKTLALNEKWMIGHYEATTSSSAPFAVCLIEISSKMIDLYKTTSSNTLVIWLFATSLLDIDINDSTGQYPVAPTADTAYGLNSGQTMSLGNRRISDSQNLNGLGVTKYPNIASGTFTVGELEMTYYQQIIRAKYVGQVSAASNLPLPGFKYGRTMYQFFLGSVIYIPTSSTTISGSSSNNLYIPFLCPSYADNAAFLTTNPYPDNGIYWVAPIVTVAWANMSSHSNITKIEAFINPAIRTANIATPLNGTGGTTYQIFTNTIFAPKIWTNVNVATETANTSMPIQTPLYISGSETTAVADQFTTNPRVKSAISTRMLSYSTSYLKVFFNPYNNSSDRQLTLKLETTPTTRKVSAISLFLNEDIGALSTEVSGLFPIQSNSDTAFKVKALTSKVYVMGKPFTRFLAYSIVQNAGLISNFPNNNYSNFVISQTIMINGIPRLDISKYSSTTKINPFNYIAVFTCNSIVPGTYGNNLSNLRLNETSAFSAFLLWHPEVSYEKWNAVISVEQSDDPIKDDKGGNIRLAGSVPTNIPVGSEITVTLTSNVLASSVSICGLIENGIANAVTDCTISGSDLTCKLSKLSKNFEICCYNIVNNNTAISATQGVVNLPYDTNVISTTILSYTSETFLTTWYKYPETTTGTAKLSNDLTPQIVTDITASGSTFAARLRNIIYSYSLSQGGMGKALFEIVLPRAAVRGMTLAIKIDLTTMNIPNFKSIIVPTFGNSDLYGSSPTQGDIFIDSVYSALDTNGIKLKLKNVLFKCGLNLSKKLSIFIWPVLTVNLSNVDVSIEMKGPDTNNLATTLVHKVTSTPTLSTTLVDNGISVDFMSVTSITPKIVDEYSEYTFSFNFNSFAANLENRSINEIMLFFPRDYYDHNELLCYNGSTRLTCNFLETAMLSIRLGSATSVTSDTRLAIRIVGIINPYLITNNGIYFACAINNTDFRTMMRTTLIRGTATINEGTLPSNNEVLYGSLVFKNNFNKHTFTIQTNSASDQGQAVFDEEALNPRDNPALINAQYISLHTFGITFDIANNNISGWENGLTFLTPNLYITFPKQYRFELRTITPTVEIEAYFMSQTDNTVITETENFVNVSSVTVVGNQLRIAITETSLTFSKYFQYFIVRVYGIPPPDDNIVQGINTTENIKFTLFNNDRTVIYRTWTNLHNFSKYDIGSSRLSDLLPQNKGFKYEYDNKRWIVDLVDKSKNTINQVIIRPGRFVPHYLVIRTNSKFITPATAEIGLETSPIAFENASYKLSTATFNDVMVRLGVACNVDLGEQIIRPRIISSNNSNPFNSFYPLAPVRAIITTEESPFGTIMFAKNTLVRRAGSQFIRFTLSEPTFSDLTIQFATGSDGDSIMEAVTIKRSTTTNRTIFRMMNKSTQITQSYLVPKVSDCYAFQHKRISFTVNGDAAIIPNNAIQPPMFVYYNSLSDNTLLSNQVKFVFSSVYTQVYIYAALTCLNNDFPTDQDMKTQNVNSTNTLSYFSDIINEGTNINDRVSTNLIFSNLVRGQRLKLKVIIESTQGDRTLRTSSSLVLSNYTLTNGTIDYFIATKSITPICTSYRFVTRPGIQVTNPLLYYWQSKFSSAGYYETGCVTAVDQYGSSAFGLPSIANETNCGTANCRFIDRNNYVVNQTSLNVSETYTICAYPLSYCETDPSNYEEVYNDILTELPTNTSFPDVLNTLVVPQFSITRISDTNAPSSPTVSNVKITGSRMTFDAKSSASISCFLKSAAPGKSYTAADFETCGANCLVADLTTDSESFSITVDTSGINASNNSTSCIENSSSFKLFGVCFNSAPCSNLKTNVLDLGTGILSTKSGNCTSTDNTTNTTPSSFISLNAMIFFILALILLA